MAGKCECRVDRQGNKHHAARCPVLIDRYRPAPTDPPSSQTHTATEAMANIELRNPSAEPPSGEDAGMVEAAVSADIERAAIEAFGRSDLFMSDTVGYQKSHVIKLIAQFAAAQTASLAARVTALSEAVQSLLEQEPLRDPCPVCSPGYRCPLCTAKQRVDAALAGADSGETK